MVVRDDNYLRCTQRSQLIQTAWIVCAALYACANGDQYCGWGLFVRVIRIGLAVSYTNTQMDNIQSMVAILSLSFTVHSESMCMIY